MNNTTKHQRLMMYLFNLFKSSGAVIVGLFLCFVTFESVKQNFEYKKDITRLTGNLEAKEKECTYFKTRNGEQAVKIQSQELTIKEVRAIYPGVIADIKNLYIPPRQMQSFTQAAGTMKTTFKTVLKDSTVTDTIKVKVLNYRDPAGWFKVRGMIRGNDTELNMMATDTIKVYNYLSKRPRPWLWIFGGRRHPEAAIINKNPSVTLTIQKSIIVKN